MYNKKHIAIFKNTLFLEQCVLMVRIIKNIIKAIIGKMIQLHEANNNR